MPNHPGHKRSAQTLPRLEGLLALEGEQLSNATLFEWLDASASQPIGPIWPPRLCTDAYLAALAITHGWRLVSFDRDFERFEGLERLMLR